MKIRGMLAVLFGVTVACSSVCSAAEYSVITELEQAEESAAAMERKLTEDASLNQDEMNDLSYDIYMIWDDTLNELWQELEESLDEEIMSDLLKEQQEWIVEKEKAAEQAGAAYGSGSIAAFVKNQKAGELTKTRVYELAAYLSDDISEPYDIEMELQLAEEITAALEKTLQEDASLTQLDMNDLSSDIYMVWDDVLNELWQELEESLDEETMSGLLAEQLKWIAEKEKAVEQAGGDGGSSAVLAKNQKAAELTKVRVYELKDCLMGTND